MEKFFKLKEQGTNISTEVMAGIHNILRHELYFIRKSKYFISFWNALSGSVPSYDHRLCDRNFSNGIIR